MGGRLVGWGASWFLEKGKWGEGGKGSSDIDSGDVMEI